MTTTFSSFSGSDIHAVFGDTVFGEIQMISYKQDREKAPVYTMGSPDLRTIARGKRLITGACVFVMFDRDGLLDAMNSKTVDASSSTNFGTNPWINKDEVAMRENSALNKAATIRGGTVSVLQGTTIVTTDPNVNEQLKFTTQTKAFHLDQLLPFDITIVGANEYGAVSKMIIKGVELMTEAGGMSIDDMVLEKQVAFIARSIEQFKPTGTGSNKVVN